jgi:hypothetical protein
MTTAEDFRGIDNRRQVAGAAARTVRASACPDTPSPVNPIRTSTASDWRNLRSFTNRQEEITLSDEMEGSIMSSVHIARRLTVAGLAAVLLLLAGAPAAASVGGGSRVDVTREADWQPNGCTSPAGNEPSGVSFLDACNAHDRCYYEHTLSQAGCDWRFYEDMNEACARATAGNARLADSCSKWAGWYWVGVLWFGGIFYLNRWDPPIWPHQSHDSPSRPGT